MSGVLLIDEPARGVMLMTLNRPAQRNAIDIALLDAANEALDNFTRDERRRAAIVTGAPPAFCAGLDLRTFSDTDAPRERVTALIRRFSQLEKPVIAAVNGAAYTGGLELALGCDFILAGEEARFADTHAKIGALSGSGMGSRLPHAVGVRFARQMMFSCEPIGARAALRVGLVNEVLPSDRLLARAVEVATAIAAHDPGLIRIAKSVLDRGSETTLAQAVQIEAAALATRKALGAISWRS